MTWNSIEIPKIERVVEREIFIGDSGRAISGYSTATRIAVKRAWDISTQYLSEAEYNPVAAYLRETLWERGWLVIHPHTTPVLARILPETFTSEVEAVGFDGQWHKWARRLSFTAEEV